jgi:molybdenum cofactor biosynthesis protein B
MISVQADPVDAGAEYRRFADSCPTAGAIASFAGLVRPASDGADVAALELEHHPSFTLKVIEAIAEAARGRFALLGLVIIHRYGRLAPGEPIVFVAAAAEHRRAAFEAVDYLMDRLKTEAPFWKREIGPGGSRWIEARPVDYADRERWQEEALMPGIDESRNFVPVRIAILTVTDTRTRETDTSGDLLVQRLESAGHVLADRRLIRDDVDLIRETIRHWADHPDVDVVISTGGTGLTGRDVTVEAVMPLFDKVIDGFSVIFHQVSYKSVGLSTIQSRACAGLVGGTFVFCLPGSTGACRDGWDEVISLQLDSRHRPCNLVEIMPRLAE